MAYTTIDDPSAHFQIALYTGNQTGRSITYDGNSNMQPDWLWGKSRSNSDAPTAIDSSRGVGNVLTPSATEAEGTGQSQYVTSFNSDGFGLGTDGGMNRNDYTYVSWGWKANGGTTSSNSDGSITSTVQANTTAGFSIVTYTGTGSNATIGHGLGATPHWIILKERNADDNWSVFHTSVGNAGKLRLNGTNATITASTIFNNTSPTSSVYTTGTDGELNGSMVAYCFTEIQGYSKFGKYTGNGSQDGTFVYTGFKPAWIMAKRTDAAKNWYIADSTRSPINVNKAFLVANSNDAEDTSGDATDSYFDILSNGFKLRQDFSHLNASGAEHVYMAFAESPFVSSKGVPTTAR